MNGPETGKAINRNEPVDSDVLRAAKVGREIEID